MIWSEEEFKTLFDSQKKFKPKAIEVWTLEMYREYLRTGIEPGAKKIKSTKKQAKFRNKKTWVDGICFDSKKEADYYRDLLILRCKGEVMSFELQPEFVVQDGYVRNDGKKILPIIYKGDFRVKYADGREEIVDTKGFKTKEFRLKQKMFELRYPDLVLKVI